MLTLGNHINIGGLPTGSMLMSGIELLLMLMSASTVVGSVMMIAAMLPVNTRLISVVYAVAGIHVGIHDSSCSRSSYLDQWSYCNRSLVCGLL